ncbi:LysR family transcriptional regulator [Roseibium suaedae]|uniref:LysR family transcriptional regulator, nitrogen assimilation regulatory protein n=1 Tax=Roseibium suaedae TaxID=735517 RepID=A0A1M7NS84_9HYPH|nr:LysR family transcriptional regulator [Roseibium suaedae]SHN06873.1 LysR family transcriptional regulator, nitrogen assimilation regulatory protein [Roseibium suaedae]
MAQLAHQFDLNRLQAFVTVAEEGSITAAAERLGVAQPALSASIRRLEADLGLTLFDRLARGVALTPAGRHLLPQVYEVFGILGTLSSELKQIATEPSGDVSIGLPPSTAAVLTQPLLRRLTERFPKVSLRLVEAMSGYLHDWISAGELDIAITFNEVETDTVISQPLMKEEMVLIGASDAMRGIPDPFPFTRLAELPIIITSGRHSLRNNLERRIEALGLKMNIRFEIDAGHQLVRLVSSGEGYGVFARSAFVEELAAGRVRAVSLSPDYIRTVCLSYHRRNKADPVIAKVIAEIEDLTREIAGTDQWPMS